MAEESHDKVGGCFASIAGVLIVGFILKACLFGGHRHGAASRPTHPSAVASVAPDGRSAEAAGYSDTAIEAAAEQAVKEKLKDPGSARFKSLMVYPQPNGTKAVCGLVNGRNGYGGKKGYQRFISAGLVKYTWVEEEVEDFESAWQATCRKR